MSEKQETPADEDAESFEALFEAYTTGMNEDIQVGDRIRGEIISIGQDTVYMDTGTKIDGVVEKAELLDKDGELPFKTGDSLDLYVVALTESEVRLSKALSGIGGPQHLQEAFQNKVPVEGKVKETCKGGFRVELLQQRAFCPISQIDINYVETRMISWARVSSFSLRVLRNGDAISWFLAGLCWRKRSRKTGPLFMKPCNRVTHIAVK